MAVARPYNTTPYNERLNMLNAIQPLSSLTTSGGGGQ